MSNRTQLHGKTVIITGAGRGIGKAIAECCLELGANVVGIAQTENSVKEIAALGEPKRVLGMQGDVADPKFATVVVEEAVGRFGMVDGLVNNAGIARPAYIQDMTAEDWHAVLDVHLTGSFNFLQATTRHMLERAKAGEKYPGAVVNIASDAARRGTVTYLNYCAAKGGLMGMTTSAARELGPHGIRVNTICYGVFETEMTAEVRSEQNRASFLVQIPMGRWGTLEEAAYPVAFMLSDAASYITGQYLSINGGYTIAI